MHPPAPSLEIRFAGPPYRPAYSMGASVAYHTWDRDSRTWWLGSQSVPPAILRFRRSTNQRPVQEVRALRPCIFYQYPTRMLSDTPPRGLVRRAARALADGPLANKSTISSGPPVWFRRPVSTTQQRSVASPDGPAARPKSARLACSAAVAASPCTKNGDSLASRRWAADGVALSLFQLGQLVGRQEGVNHRR